MKKLYITLYEDAEEKEYISVDAKTIKSSGFTPAEYRKALIKELQEDAKGYNEEYIEYVWEVIDTFKGKTYKVGNTAWERRIKDDAEWLTMRINLAYKNEDIDYSIKFKNVLKAFKENRESGFYNLAKVIESGEFKTKLNALMNS